MPGCVRLSGWVAAAGLLGIAALAAQSQERVTVQDQQDTPTFRTEVNYVRVDVFVTRDGSPVTDLRPEDFEILDQGVPQEISQFEYIQVRGNVPEDIRREPSTVAESRQMLQQSRGRVFVLFLDTGHVDADASRTIGGPLVDLLDNLLGADDLIGVMTPGMSALDVTFARKTVALRRLLDHEWWGERNRTVTTDPVESRFEYCYPPHPEVVERNARSALASELIERRRETMTLEALEDLVRYLRDAREERKALIAITQGWRLFEPDFSLLGPREDAFRIGDIPVGPGPETDRAGTRAVPVDALLEACERDRLALAHVDNALRFRRLMDLANRANASFYPVDPRGLAVFDAPIGVPDPSLTLQEDNARLRQRQLSLRELAERTDGLAVVGTNSIREGLRRVVDDLSSYYLLGYFATGVEMDGRFHALTVRVRRPGVTVRARRGYLAPGPDELKAAMAAAAAPAPSAAETLRTQRLERALGALGSLSRDLPLRTHVAAGWAPDGAPTFQVVGELARTGEWADGADVEVTLTTPGGQTLETGTATLATGARAFEVALAPDSRLEPGDYAIRIRAHSHRAGTPPATDVVTLSMPAAPDGTGALFFRRGPSTGNREVATADRRFRRTERLRLDLPWRPDETPAARLLDRTGQDLAIPVATAVRSTGGTSWVSAEIVLAPLAAGDYMVAISSAGPSGDEREVWTAFRIVP